MAGGYTDWKRNGFDTELPGGLIDAEKRAFYSRHHPHPRGRRGRLGPKLLEYARVLLILKGPAASARPYRSTSPRPASGTPPRDRRRRCASTRRTLQRQVLHSTRTAHQASGRQASAKRGRCRRSIPTSRSRRTTSGSPPRTSTASSPPAGTAIVERRRQLPDAVPDQQPPRCGTVFQLVHEARSLPLRGPGDRLQATKRRPPCLPLPPSTVPPPPAHLAPSCAESGVLGVLPGIFVRLAPGQARRFSSRSASASLARRDALLRRRPYDRGSTRSYLRFYSGPPGGASDIRHHPVHRL